MRGIYLIRNIINNKVYVGQSEHIENRWRLGHIKKLNNNNHFNFHLQNAWNKYGESSFEMEILEEIDNDLNMDTRENFWIDYYDSLDMNLGYNLKKEGHGGKLSDYVKNKISKSLLNKKHEPERIEKMRNSLKGKKISQETRIKISNANKNRKCSLETRIKISNSKKLYKFTDSHKNNISSSLIGRHINEEVKQKISKSMNGVRKSLKARENMSAAQKGKIVSEETKIKISNANKNRKLSNNTKKKMSDRMKINHPTAKLNKEIVMKIVQEIENKVKLVELSEKYNVSYSAIKAIKSGKYWSHVTGITKK